MPRAARLDAPLMFHHVIDRGIERRPVFITDDDRVDFLGRLGALIAADHPVLEGWGDRTREPVRPLDRQ